MSAIRAFLLVFAWMLQLFHAALAADMSAPKKHASLFALSSEFEYKVCQIEVKRNVAMANFMDRPLTHEELFGCMQRDEEKFDKEYSKLKNEIKRNREALSALKEYYAEWKAIMEGDLANQEPELELDRLRKRQAVLELSFE